MPARMNPPGNHIYGAQTHAAAREGPFANKMNEKLRGPRGRANPPRFLRDAKERYRIFVFLLTPKTPPNAPKKSIAPIFTKDKVEMGSLINIRPNKNSSA